MARDNATQRAMRKRLAAVYKEQEALDKQFSAKGSPYASLPSARRPEWERKKNRELATEELFLLRWTQGNFS